MCSHNCSSFSDTGALNDVYALDLVTNTWETKTPLSYKIWDHSCILMENEESGKEIYLVTGANSVRLSILNLSSGIWREGQGYHSGNDIGTRTIRWHDSFIVTGGYNHQLRNVWW